VNVDSKAVVEAVHNQKIQNLVGRSLVDRIRRLLECDWEVNVQHAYRKSNQCPDALANIDRNMLTDMYFFDSCSHEISHLFTADNLRFLFIEIF
jgi:hypothetical protein